MHTTRGERSERPIAGRRCGIERLLNGIVVAPRDWLRVLDRGSPQGRAVRRRIDSALMRAGGRLRERLGPAEPQEKLDSITAVPNAFTRQAIGVAVTLGLPDLIDAGVETPADLARATATNPDAVARLLRHLVNREVLTEPSPGVVALSDVGALLKSSHPDQPAAYFHLDAASTMFDAVVREMMYSIRTGQSAWSQVHPVPFWEYLAQSSTVAASFDQDMLKRSRLLGPELAAGYEWRDFGVVVDVGGGNGAVLAALLAAEVDMRGVLVEVAAAAERAEQTLRRGGLIGRCDVVSGSFFDDLPRGGDAYLLSWVLHDWGDDDAVRILTRCREAAAPDGRILVIEDPVDVVPDTELDLRMLLYFGSRERTKSQYEQLAARAGLTAFKWIQLPTTAWILDCRPA